ncbi:hypothetical protein AB3R30_18815 [Leptolyngbyaceae cyanobacterium UHCC 1019]
MENRNLIESPLQDLSDALAQIHIHLERLGLTYESDRVQAWVDRAGRAYLARYRETGQKPPMPPPYPTLHWLPAEMVIALAAQLSKIDRGEADGGRDATE